MGVPFTWLTLYNRTFHMGGRGSVIASVGSLTAAVCDRLLDRQLQEEICPLIQPMNDKNDHGNWMFIHVMLHKTMP